MIKPQAARDAYPARWAEWLLRLFLRKRDRDAVTGDLLEEYRVVIVPTRGRFGAQRWYLGQALGLVDSTRLGVALGGLWGASILVGTLIDPLGEDTPLAVGGMFGSVFVLLGAIGFAACRRTGRLVEALKAGALVGAIAFSLFDVAGILRVNLFLDTIRARSDWQNLIARFEQSGFHSLRVYANYEYATNTYVIVVIGLVAGAVSGAMGGILGSLGRRPTPTAAER